MTARMPVYVEPRVAVRMVERAATINTDLDALEALNLNDRTWRAYDRLTAELVKINTALDLIAIYSREDYPR